MLFIKKYLKWLSTFLVLTGILLTNLNIYPVNIMFHGAGVVGWTIAGFLSKDNRQIKRTAAPTSRKAKFQSILLDKSFEPENPKSLEDLTESTCKWPVGHPNEEKFYFCGRKPEGEFPYCKLHVLYAFQPKGSKEEVLDKEDEVPEFIEKKVKSA